jgi:DNA-directed RNA polymerase subunit omega
MARVTVEDCLEHIENRFALVMLATQRARELRRRSTRIFPSSNKEAVHALREIAAGYVFFDDKSKKKLSKALGLDELEAEGRLGA